MMVVTLTIAPGVLIRIVGTRDDDDGVDAGGGGQNMTIPMTLINVPTSAKVCPSASPPGLCVYGSTYYMFINSVSTVAVAAVSKLVR